MMRGSPELSLLLCVPFWIMTNEDGLQPKCLSPLSCYNPLTIEFHATIQWLPKGPLLRLTSHVHIFAQE